MYTWLTNPFLLMNDGRTSWAKSQTNFSKEAKSSIFFDVFWAWTYGRMSCNAGNTKNAAVAWQFRKEGLIWSVNPLPQSIPNRLSRNSFYRFAVCWCMQSNSVPLLTMGIVVCTHIRLCTVNCAQSKVGREHNAFGLNDYTRIWHGYGQNAILPCLKTSVARYSFPSVCYLYLNGKSCLCVFFIFSKRYRSAAELFMLSTL